MATNPITGLLGPAQFIAGIAVGTGVGTGVARAVEPEVQEIANAAWHANPTLPPDAILLAQGVAQGQVDSAAAHDWAQQQGLSGSAFQALVQIANGGPGVAAALELWRRGLIDAAGFQRACLREGLEAEWITALAGLQEQLLSPEILANARQQMFVTVDRQHAESALQGVNAERADILFELAGLPPGVGEALQMLRRGIIDQPTFRQIVAEGHTKTKYTDELLQLEQNILSVAQAAEGVIRERIPASEGHTIAAQNGYTAADFDLLVEFGGRPPGIGQGLQMLNRGVIDTAGFREIVARSNVRTQYTDDYLGLRYHAPSLFQVARLAQGGQVSDATIQRWLIWLNFSPADATELAAGFAKGKTQRTRDLTAAQIEVLYEGRIMDESKTRTLLTALGYDASEIDSLLLLADARRERRFLEAAVSAVHAQYVNHKIDRGVAVNLLGQIIPSSNFRDDLMALWDMERDAHTRPLTEGQITTALRKKAIGTQTAHDRLLQLGVGDADARIIVTSVTEHFGAAGELAAALP